MTNLDVKKLVVYWTKSAEEDWMAYLSLRRAKRFAHALFFLHLTLEKIIKALVVKSTKVHSPYSHSLSFLLGKSGVAAPERYIELLTEMSKFNMQTRYPDERLAFYKSIDAKTSQYWHKHGEELRQWLLSLLKGN